MHRHFVCTAHLSQLRSNACLYQFNAIEAISRLALYLSIRAVRLDGVGTFFLDNFFLVTVTPFHLLNPCLTLACIHRLIMRLVDATSMCLPILCFSLPNCPDWAASSSENCLRNRSNSLLCTLSSSSACLETAHWICHELKPLQSIMWFHLRSVFSKRRPWLTAVRLAPDLSSFCACPSAACVSSSAVCVPARALRVSPCNPSRYALSALSAEHSSSNWRAFSCSLAYRASNSDSLIASTPFLASASASSCAAFSVSCLFSSSSSSAALINAVATACASLRSFSSCTDSATRTPNLSDISPSSVCMDSTRDFSNA